MFKKQIIPQQLFSEEIKYYWKEKNGHKPYQVVECIRSSSKKEVYSWKCPHKKEEKITSN